MHVVLMRRVLYHSVLRKVADSLPQSAADEVRGVAEEDGAAREARAGGRILFDGAIRCLHWLPTSLHLWMWSGWRNF